MANKKTDLRIIKTKASIKREFLALLQKKSVKKITVTELADAALINKGTFYLHYPDIYALYEETIHDEILHFCDRIDFYKDFFDAPADFAANMMQELKKELWETTFPHEDTASTRVNVPLLLTTELKKRLYALQVIEPSIENDLKLDYVLNGVFILSFQYGHDYPDAVVKTIAEAISLLYPLQ